MHARVRTIGISENVFAVDSTVEYNVLDVGGDRSQRLAWIPYLTEELRSIIFVTNIGAFDQVRAHRANAWSHLTRARCSLSATSQRLQEDVRVNKIQDSLNLFREIAVNPLLTKASIVLLLNKM